MARRGSGPMQKVPVPSNLQPFFRVTSFYVPLHGKGRKGRHKQAHVAGLHGNGRGHFKAASPWHKGAPTGK